MVKVHFLQLNLKTKCTGNFWANKPKTRKRKLTVKCEWIVCYPRVLINPKLTCLDSISGTTASADTDLGFEKIAQSMGGTSLIFEFDS